MSLRAAIVEDEELARRRLAKLLLRHPEVTLVGEAQSCPEALELVEAQRPDLLFLDIQLEGCTGFELLAQLPEPPLVIFTTSHDEYALQAFAAEGLDYLLKPVEAEDLERALRKLARLTRPPTGDLEKRLQRLLERAERGAAGAAPQRIPVKLGERTLLIDLAQVTHFSAKDKYVFVHTLGGKEYIVEPSIGELEQRLDPRRFVRVHRATLVNVDHVREIQAWFGGKYRLLLGDKGSVEVLVSKGMAANLRAIIPF